MNQTTLTSIPLNQLKAGPNPRKIKSSVNADAQLVASIKAHGLIHPLTVVKNGAGYNVVIGTRRLAALQKIHDKDDASIPCMISTQENELLTGTAIAENIVREKMHPIDEWKAFDKLRKQKVSIEDIAIQFGTNETVVRKRLKLSELSSPVLKAFENNDIDIQTAMAFTLLSTTAQMKTFKDGKPHEMVSWQIKRLAVGEKPKMSYAKFKPELYTGTFTSDLFDNDGEEYADDKALFVQLQKEWCEKKIKSMSKTRPFTVLLIDKNTYEDKRFCYAQKGEKPGYIITLHSNTGQVTIDDDSYVLSKKQKAKGQPDDGTTPEPEAKKTSDEISGPQAEILAVAQREMFRDVGVFELIRLFFKHGNNAKANHKDEDYTYITTNYGVELKADVHMLTDDDLLEAFRECILALMPIIPSGADRHQRILLDGKGIRDFWKPDETFIGKFNNDQLEHLAKKYNINLSGTKKKSERVAVVANNIKIGRTNLSIKKGGPSAINDWLPKPYLYKPTSSKKK